MGTLGTVHDSSPTTENNVFK
jgi:hypothetical protein